MLKYKTIAAAALLIANIGTNAFQPSSNTKRMSMSLSNSNDSVEPIAESNDDSRRMFLTQSSATVIAGIFGTTVTTFSTPQAAGATVYLDPAMYGDQENRISAVDSLRESVRRAILKKPELSTSFFALALLDSLSFNVKTGSGGPDGRIVRALLETTQSSPYLDNLKQAAATLVESKKNLRKLTAITIADAVAIGGAESIAAIGGPTLSVQVGRTDAPQGAVFDSEVPLDLFNGSYSSNQVRSYFLRSGMTEREMTAIMGALLTIEKVEKDKDPASWKRSAKPQFRERGKIGRASEFKRLSDEDIERELAKDGFDDDDEEEEDEGWYIADSFGTKDQSFGKKAGDLDPKTFNKYIKECTKYINAKNTSEQEFGWIGALLLDKQNPSTQQYLAKYGASYLNYEKDLGIAYNSMTQLGAEFTGGKYENLLKNRPRRTLNDD